MAAKVVGTSAVALGTDTTRAAKGIQVRADPENSGVVYLGYASSVTSGTVAATDGMPLAAGESYFVPRDKAKNTTRVFLIASAADQKVFFDVI